MRLLDRYLLRELLVPLAYCLGGFLIFWISFDLLTELDEFQRRLLRPADVAEYYLVRLPELLVTVIPIALLLALLYALTHHSRHQELTAMRAAGVGMWRMCAPYFGVGAAFSLGLLALNELWVPEANAVAQRVLNRRLADPASSEAADQVRNLTFLNESRQRLWNIGLFDRRTAEMIAPNVEWVQPDGSRRRLAARAGRYEDGVWTFLEAQELVYPAPTPLLPLHGVFVLWGVRELAAREPQTIVPYPPRVAERLAVPELDETPDQIRSEIKFSTLSNVRAARRATLSLREIVAYRRLHPQLSRRDEFKLLTQLHGRLAEPWTCLVVVLIAVPFGAPGGRRNVFVGVASSLFIGFTYFILMRFGLALGTGGYLPPWLAAWLPNLLFATAGVWLTQRLR